MLLTYKIDPSDKTDLPHATAAFIVESPGDVRVTCADGGIITFLGIPAREWINVKCGRIWETGTTASGIHGAIGD